MNQFLNAQHTWVTLDSEALAAALLEAVDARDLPGMADVDSSLLLFCREIRKTATVALSGECADEIFGGYPWYRDKTVRERYGFPWAQSTAYRVSFLSRRCSAALTRRRILMKATAPRWSKLPSAPVWIPWNNGCARCLP